MKKLTLTEIREKIKDEVLDIKGHEKGWQENYQANMTAGKAAADYAEPIFQAADKWGRLMQVEMRERKAKTLTPEIVKETAEYFGDWGIRARQLLVPTWSHGVKLGKILNWPEEVVKAQRQAFSNRAIRERQRTRE